MILGAHVSIQGGFTRALERALSYNFDCFQAFGGNPRGWRELRVNQADIASYREKIGKTNIRRVFLHSSYLINLASPREEIRQKSVESLKQSLLLANLLGANGLITHLGSVGVSDREEGIETLLASLTQVFEGVETGKMIFENSASKGGVIGGDLEELGQIIRLFEDRIGFCLDTAHAYSYGFDIRKKEGLEQTLEIIDQSIGIAQLEAVHFNDSKFPLGSNRDQHANIGEGQIGWDGFKIIANHPQLRGLPLIMETPGFKTEERWEEEIRKIRGLQEC